MTMCSTPTRKDFDISLNQSLQFSPVVVSESPVSKIPQHGNLTGLPRKVRDSAADVYNNIQNWNRRHLQGVAVLNNIVTLKAGSMPDHEGMNAETTFPEGLQEQCDQLEEICMEMQEVVRLLTVIAKEFNNLVQLQLFQNASLAPLFLTWPTTKFSEVCQEICDAYNRELAVKYCVKENIAHCKSKSLVMLHLAAWVHQPYINDNTILMAESLLHETGHRKLSQLKKTT